MHAANEVIMPVLGMIQDTGKIVQWLIKEGQPVIKGQPLFEVETDKAVAEIEAPVSGILCNIQAQIGDDVPVGQVIALILPPDQVPNLDIDPSDRTKAAPQKVESVKAELPEKPRPLTTSPLAARMIAEHNLDIEKIRPQGGRIEKADVLAYIQAQERASSQQSAGRPLASPKARRMAAEFGLDLKQVRGSGPDNAILAADLNGIKGSTAAATPVQHADQANKSSESPMVTSSNWRVMATHTTQAWTTAPHFYLMREVKASRLAAWYKSLQDKNPKQISITDLLIRLVAATLKKHPRVNARWDNGQICIDKEINIGLAVAFEDGLAVPVIHHADQLSLLDIALERKELVLRTQQGKLRPEELQGGTITISNLGMYGVDAFHAVLNSPQAALLAVGRIAERVTAVNGQPSVQLMMTLTITFDHRVVDGARGAEFLRTLAENIEEPLGILE